MRPRDRDAHGADLGVERGLVGIGDVLASVPDSLEEAVAAATRAHGEKASRMLRRFAALPDGVLVWTRDSGGGYWLGRIEGPWRYDDSRAAHATGIHHVRPARWRPGPFGEPDVPAAVAATFARGGRNLQRIDDRAAELRSAELWSA
jgi:hypothetical protein